MQIFRGVLQQADLRTLPTPGQFGGMLREGAPLVCCVGAVISAVFAATNLATGAPLAHAVSSGQELFARHRPGRGRQGPAIAGDLACSGLRVRLVRGHCRVSNHASVFRPMCATCCAARGQRRCRHTQKMPLVCDMACVCCRPWSHLPGSAHGGEADHGLLHGHPRQLFHGCSVPGGLRPWPGIFVMGGTCLVCTWQA